MPKLREFFVQGWKDLSPTMQFIVLALLLVVVLDGLSLIFGK